jgi:hypothetical protein
VDLLAAIQILALRNTIKFDEGAADHEYALRRIFRWYSKTFYTALHVVETLPLEDILRAWWEQKYEDMTPEEIEAERLSLTQDPYELRKLQMAEDAADADIAEDMALLVKEEEAEAARAKAAGNTNKLNIPIAPDNPFRSSIQKDPELVMGPTIRDKPEISMTFPTEDLDLEGDSLGLLAKPRRR